MPPRPMPRLTSAKLTPKYCWRSGPSTIAATMALNAGQVTPETPISVVATIAFGTVSAKARMPTPTMCTRQATRVTRRAPNRSTAAPPGPVTMTPTAKIHAISRPATSRPMPRTSCR